MKQRKKNSGNSSNITFDDTPVTGDSFSIILAVVVAIIHLVQQNH